MKRNIIAISLMAAGLFTFGNVYAQNIANCTDFYAELANGDVICASNLQEAINKVKENKSATGEITLLKEETIGGSPTIDKDVTINLAGNTLTIADGQKINITNANVTFKNGTITLNGSSTTNMFNVTSKDNETSLTFEDDIKLKFKNSDSGGAVVKVLTADAKTTINVNGTWTISSEIVDCTPGQDKNLTINLNANVTSDKQLVSIDAGSSIVNVLGGKYISSKGHAFDVKMGTLNISGGAIIAKSKGNAIVLRGSDDDSKPLVLNITGGEMIAEGTDYYAIYFAKGASNGKYSFAGGTYTSGEDSKGKYLPAMYIEDKDFLEEQQGIITGGTYNHGIVGNTKVGNAVRPAENAIKNLLGASVTATTDENGNIVVTTPAPAEEQQPTNPEQTGSQAGSDDGSNTGDNTIDDSPQTYDGIMSYVTMALTSVGAVALSLKKVLSR